MSNRDKRYDSSEKGRTRRLLYERGEKGKARKRRYAERRKLLTIKEIAADGSEGS